MTSVLESKAAEVVDETLKTIVIVENESVDYLIVRGQLAKLRVRNPIHRTTTVAALIDYLKRAYQLRRMDPGGMPCVVMMELRLPKCSGLEGLAALRANQDFRNIPVLAMGGADRVATLRSAVEAGASGYLVKPFQADDFSKVVADLGLPLQFAPEPKKNVEREKPALKAEAVEEPSVTKGLMGFAKALRLY